MGETRINGRVTGSAIGVMANTELIGSAAAGLAEGLFRGARGEGKKEEDKEAIFTPCAEDVSASECPLLKAAKRIIGILAEPTLIEFWRSDME